MTGRAPPFFACSDVTIWQADARAAWSWLPQHSVDAIVTSPPYYGLRDYGVDGQLGVEATPSDYVDDLAELLTGYARVLKPAGSLWLNLGDSYASRWRAGNDPGGSGATTLQGTAQRSRIGTTAGVGGPHTSLSAGPGDLPPKSLLLIPERVALALADRGWILRNKIVWAKPNAMPSSVRDRLANTWEVLFHLVRAPRYHYDLHAIREPLRHPDAADATRTFGGRNKGASGRAGAGLRTAGVNTYTASDGANPGDVWTIPTVPTAAAHFAPFPPDLVRRPILATVPEQVCSACGHARQRFVQRVTHLQPRQTTTKADRLPRAPGQPPPGATSSARARNHHHACSTAARTVGWSDCGCDAGWTPGVVLDPFAGSGTTAVMARRLGRHAVLVDLNPDYCHLAADRLRQDVLPLDQGFG